MSVCTFNSLTNREYSNLLIVAPFSNKSFSGKTSLPVKNSYLLTFSDKAEILAVSLLSHFDFSFAQFCYHLLLLLLFC